MAALPASCPDQEIETGLIPAPLKHLCAHLDPDLMSLCYSEANPLTLFATAIQPSGTIAPDLCQHRSAGEDHLVAQGYRVPRFLPRPVHILSMGRGQFGGQSCLYVPLPARQNNSTILANVARHAGWKLNCFATEAAL